MDYQNNGYQRSLLLVVKTIVNGHPAHLMTEDLPFLTTAIPM